MNIIGIDIAKSNFQICLMNSRGKILGEYKCSRDELISKVDSLGGGKIAMESSGGSNHWYREFSSRGYDVKLISGKLVKPYVKSNKNDARDAEAICEAASREHMRFVSGKSELQQDIQSLIMIRAGDIKARTAKSNQIRGLLMEYGYTIAQGVSNVRKNLPEIIELYSHKHSEIWRENFLSLYEDLVRLDEKISKCEARLKIIAKNNDLAKRLMEIPGIGYLTAVAFIAMIPNPDDFKDGRQFAAYLGLTPYQKSSGGKTILCGISKRGNKILRTLLVQGASSLSRSIKSKQTKIRRQEVVGQQLNSLEQWYCDLCERKSSTKLVNIAMANKMARIVWHVMMGDSYKTRAVNETPLRGVFAMAA